MERIVRLSACGMLLSAVVSASTVMAQDDAVIKALTQMEDQWAIANMKKDGAAVGRLLAPGYLAMNEDGRVMDKATMIQSVNSNPNTIVSGKNGDYKGRVFGNTAIVVGIATEVVKTAKGTDTRRFAWTDTWMKQDDGQWLCIASQAARLAQ